MVKDMHRFHCPCCKKLLEFEARTQKVRVLQFDPGGEADPLGRLVDAEKHESDRLGDVFARAAREHGSQADKFDDLLADALGKAKEDQEKKPPSPFDLD
jgi:hypothetical protein